jgi:hypothetical protein
MTATGADQQVAIFVGVLVTALRARGQGAHWEMFFFKTRLSSPKQPKWMHCF